VNRSQIGQRLRRTVRIRADNRCDVSTAGCQRGPANWSSTSTHVVAVQHGRTGTADNLAFSCGSCNLHKGTNLSSTDPATSRPVWLFNRRTDTWGRHFRWVGAILVGRTPRGRATINLLQISAPMTLATRAALKAEGRH